MNNTADWLAGLELSQYLEIFNSNDLDWDTLPELVDANLKEIGVHSLGHRKKLLRAISQLQPAPDADVIEKSPKTTSSDTQRRQVTVMFCDLVGSTELSTVLDPEDMDAVIRNYQETVTPIVRELGGHVARFSGDGILIYFGYPQALELESERAISAALSAAAAVSKANFHPSSSSQVRVGIATGDVVIGGLFEEGKLYEAMATGETPNLAARLQGVAEPGGIIVCDTTRRLAGNLFGFRDAGEREIRGFDGTVQAWAVTGSLVTEDRFQALRSAEGLTQLVGREREQEILFANWQQVQQGHGRGVFLTGEAGAGKSRLFKALADSIVRPDLGRVYLYCEAYRRNTPFHPLIKFVRRGAGLNHEDDPAIQRDLLGSFLLKHHDQPEEALPLLARLLNVSTPELDAGLEGESPQRLREETVRALIGLLQHRAQTGPVLMLVEDLHFADPSTLLFLERLAPSLRERPILLVTTARPEFNPEPLNENDFDRVELKGLSEGEIMRIIERVAGTTALPAGVKSAIIEKSDGIPLFVEEITKSVLDSVEDAVLETFADFKIQDKSVPDTLQSVLMARLDRLGDAKEFALTCSVMGREFSLEAVARVSTLESDEIDSAIEKLLQAELIREVPGYSSPRYKFHHALARDAAYNNLLRSRRQEIHARVANLLIEHYPQTVRDEPELLAVHFSGAGRYPEANQFYLKAGLKAVKSGSNLEGAEHLQTGLGLLDRVEDEKVRLALELELQMTLGPALIAVRGFAAPEVEATFSRARTLCKQMDTSEKLFPALHGLMDFYIVRSEFESALQIGDESWAAIGSNENSGHRLELYWTLASASLFHGEVRESITLLEQGLEIYDRVEHAGHALVYGQDPGVAVMTHLAVGLNLVGEYQRAQEIERQVLELVGELNHPFTMAQARCFLQACASERGEIDNTMRLAEVNLAFCEAQGFPLFMGMSMIYKGWCLASKGDSAGIELMDQGFATYAMSGATISSSVFLRMIAEGHLICGDCERGLAVIEQAMQYIADSGEALYLPSILLVKARILMQIDAAGHDERVRALLLQSVKSARAAGTMHFVTQATALSEQLDRGH